MVEPWLIPSTNYMHTTNILLLLLLLHMVSRFNKILLPPLLLLFLQWAWGSIWSGKHSEHIFSGNLCTLWDETWCSSPCEQQYSWLRNLTTLATVSKWYNRTHSESFIYLIRPMIERTGEWHYFQGRSSGTSRRKKSSWLSVPPVSTHTHSDTVCEREFIKSGKHRK